MSDTGTMHPKWKASWERDGTEKPRVSADAVSAIAAWWVDKLKADAITKGNGDTSNPMKTGLIALLQKKSASEVDTQKFYFALCNVFAGAMWDEFSKETPRAEVKTGMDYYPSGPLAEACRIAGVYDEAMPIKAWMRISRECVIAACGYRAKPSIIWGDLPDRAGWDYDFLP